VAFIINSSFISNLCLDEANHWLWVTFGPFGVLKSTFHYSINKVFLKLNILKCGYRLSTSNYNKIHILYEFFSSFQEKQNLDLESLVLLIMLKNKWIFLNFQCTYSWIGNFGWDTKTHFLCLHLLVRWVSNKLQLGFKTQFDKKVSHSSSLWSNSLHIVSTVSMKFNFCLDFLINA